MRCGARGAGREAGEAAGDRGGVQRAGEGATTRLGAGHGEERTENMDHMIMTLEVSKLSG